MIDKLVREQVKKMESIDWGNLPDDNPYRLLWGENQTVLEESIQAIEKEARKINLYPDPAKNQLKQALCLYNKVGVQNLVITNGSDDAIELLAKVFLNIGDEVITPIPTFPVYESDAELMGAKVVNVELDETFQLDVNLLLKKVTPKTKIVWIASPNNPTGNFLLSQENVELLAKKLKCILVIDECYFELAGITAVSLIKKYENIVILRSFSKIFSLAGARLGYIMAGSEIIRYLEKCQTNLQPFSVNRLAQAAGTAILNNKGLVKKAVDLYKETKTSFEKLLSSVKGIEVIPTQTTFCLVKLPVNISASDVKKELQKQQIFVKDCSIYKGLGSRYLYLGVPQKKFQKKVIKILSSLTCKL